jgi:glycogenin
MEEEIFLTTLNTDNYLTGVLVLAKNIKELCSHKLTVLVSEDLKEETYQVLKKLGIPYLVMENSRIPEGIAQASGEKSYFGHWINTLFKLKIFELTQYKKIVYVDSDMMVQESLDELFNREDMSAVIAGRSYPGNEAFKEINSGIFVFRPKEGLYKELMNLIPVVAGKKQYFGDQDILAEYYKEWKYQKNLHLPEEYNVFFQYYDYYSKHSSVKVVHFIGKVKPWMMSGGQAMMEYMKCIVKGNYHGLSIMKKYRRYIKEAQKY